MKALPIVALTMLAGIGVGQTPESSESSDAVALLRSVESQVQSVIAKTGPATVLVGSATGVIVTSDGVVATAAHVAAYSGRRIPVRLQDGRTVEGVVRGLCWDEDAALVELEGEGPWPFAPLRATAPEPGDWCVAIGHPEGLVEGRGTVVRLGRTLVTGPGTLGVDVRCAGGDSGGPLFDLDGQVLGINSCPLPVSPQIRGSGLYGQRFVPSTDLLEIWTRLDEDEEWGRLAPFPAHRIDLAHSKEDPRLVAALSPVVRQARRSVVRIRCAGRDVALGTVVGPDGWILTRAAALSGPATVVVGETAHDARVTGVAPEDDLAMLKIEVAGLPTVTLAEGEPPGAGSLVLAVGLADVPLALGVVSVAARDPREDRPLSRFARLPFDYEGAWSGNAQEGFRMVGLDVGSISRPEATDLEVGDRLLKAGGHDIVEEALSETVLIAILQDHGPGTRVPFTVRRGDRVVEGSALLHAAPAREPGRHPRVLQHDAHAAGAVGGPLVDLDGRCVGVTVFHEGRRFDHESDAVPADRLRALLFDLASGRLSRQ